MPQLRTEILAGNGSAIDRNLASLVMKCFALNCSVFVGNTWMLCLFYRNANGVDIKWLERDEERGGFEAAYLQQNMRRRTPSARYSLPLLLIVVRSWDKQAVTSVSRPTESGLAVDLRMVLTYACRGGEPQPQKIAISSPIDREWRKFIASIIDRRDWSLLVYFFFCLWALNAFIIIISFSWWLPCISSVGTYY